MSTKGNNFKIGDDIALLSMGDAYPCNTMDVGVVYNPDTNTLRVMFVHREGGSESPVVSYLNMTLSDAVAHWHAIGNMLKELVDFLVSGKLLPAPADNIDARAALEEVKSGLRLAGLERPEHDGMTMQ